MKQSKKMNVLLLSTTLVVASCGGGGSGSGLESTEKESYELNTSEAETINGVGCSTGKRSYKGADQAEVLRSYCVDLTNHSLNHHCAYETRKLKFERNCFGISGLRWIPEGLASAPTPVRPGKPTRPVRVGRYAAEEAAVMAYLSKSQFVGTQRINEKLQLTDAQLQSLEKLMGEMEDCGFTLSGTGCLDKKTPFTNADQGFIPANDLKHFIFNTSLIGFENPLLVVFDLDKFASNRVRVYLTKKAFENGADLNSYLGDSLSAEVVFEAVFSAARTQAVGEMNLRKLYHLTRKEDFFKGMTDHKELFADYNADARAYYLAFISEGQVGPLLNEPFGAEQFKILGLSSVFSQYAKYPQKSLQRVGDLFKAIEGSDLESLKGFVSEDPYLGMIALLRLHKNMGTDAEVQKLYITLLQNSTLSNSAMGHLDYFKNREGQNFMKSSAEEMIKMVKSPEVRPSHKERILQVLNDQAGLFSVSQRISLLESEDASVAVAVLEGLDSVSLTADEKYEVSKRVLKSEEKAVLKAGLLFATEKTVSESEATFLKLLSDEDKELANLATQIALREKFNSGKYEKQLMEVFNTTPQPHVKANAIRLLALINREDITAFLINNLGIESTAAVSAIGNSLKVKPLTEAQLLTISTFSAHQSVTTRLVVIDILATSALPFTTVKLAQMMNDKDYSVTYQAMYVLLDNKVPRNLLEVQALMIETSQSSTASTRKLSVPVLQRIGTTDALKRLVSLVGDSDYSVGYNANEVLHKVSPEKLQGLESDILAQARAAKEESSKKRYISLLDLLKGQGAAELLVQLLTDVDYSVGYSAREALLKFPVADLVSSQGKLVTLARSSVNTDVQKFLISVLRLVRTTETAIALVELVGNREYSVAYSAKESLLSFPVNLLVSAQGSVIKQVQLGATNEESKKFLISIMGLVQTSEVVQVLAPMIADRDYSVGYRAKETLLKFPKDKIGQVKTILMTIVNTSANQDAVKWAKEVLNSIR